MHHCSHSWCRLRRPRGEPGREADLRGRVDLPARGVEPGPGRAVHHRLCPEVRGEVGECLRGGHRDTLRGQSDMINITLAEGIFNNSI